MVCRTYFSSVLLLLLTVMCTSFFPAASYAQDNTPNINERPATPIVAIENARIAETFACDGSGNPTGYFYMNAQTCQEPGKFSVFGNVVCTFENVISGTFGLVFCKLQRGLVPIMAVVMTLFVMVVGILFLAGIMPMNTREFMVNLFKFVLVYSFATQADLAVGVAYKFFMSVAQESITWVLNPLFPGQNYSAGGILTNSDRMFEAMGDKTIFDTISLMSLIGILIPPLGTGLVKSVTAMMAFVVRGIMGYLLALIGITFMMLLSPIFLSFALYRSTYSYFETWLKYLASFSLQMMIMLSFTTLTRIIDGSGFKESFYGILRTYKTELHFGFLHWPINMKSICPFKEVVKIIDPNNPGSYTYKALDQYNPAVDFTGKIILQCLYPDDPNSVIPITDLLFSQSSGTGFLVYLVTVCVSVMLVCMAGDNVLIAVPEIAKQLAGVNTAGRLGGITPSDVVIAQKQFHLLGSSAISAAGQSAEAGYLNTPANGIMGLITRGPRQLLNSGSSGIDGFLYGSKGPGGKTEGLYEEFITEAGNLGRSPDEVNQINNPAMFGGGDPNDGNWLFYLQRPGQSRSYRQLSEEEQFQEYWFNRGPGGLMPDWMEDN